MATVILGMHRSGTSLVASMLEAMGFALGFEYLEPDERNPHGYFEDTEWLKLNKDLLARCGVGWKTTFVRRRRLLDAIKPEHDRITRLVAMREALRREWAFKDPRTCLTIWALAPYLPRLRLIVVRRERQPLLMSLARVYGPAEDWPEVIEYYQRNVNSFIQQYTPPVHTVRFEHLVDLRQRHQEALELALFLGLGAIQASQAVMRVVDA